MPRFCRSIFQIIFDNWLIGYRFTPYRQSFSHVTAVQFWNFEVSLAVLTSLLFIEIQWYGLLRAKGAPFNVTSDGNILMISVLLHDCSPGSTICFSFKLCLWTRAYWHDNSQSHVFRYRLLRFIIWRCRYIHPLFYLKIVKRLVIGCCFWPCN